MRPENFQVDDSIYFQHGGFDLDLHNNYDFVGFTYSVAERLVEMRWHRGTSDWVDTRPPARLLLRLHGITHFSASPRDPEMPFTEDDCLSGISFLAPEPPEPEGVTSNGVNSSWHWVFSFQSGFSLRLAGERAHLSTQEV